LLRLERRLERRLPPFIDFFLERRGLFLGLLQERPSFVLCFNGRVPAGQFFLASACAFLAAII
jgi:hypothetical protein